ncbi:MAG: bifunctional RNase H/acid phosphatase [Nocardioides sp.]
MSEARERGGRDVVADGEDALELRAHQKVLSEARDAGSVRRVLIAADGGSRGNPGPAGYGAVLRDADTGEVLAEAADTLGVASNNVAEYSGLIAGLKLAAEFAPEAEIEVRMDSKLVVEQMSGNWKIKHPSMRPLAIEAQRLAPFGTSYTWVPREENKYADRLANEALDGRRSGVRVPALLAESETGPAVRTATTEQGSARGWSPDSTITTTLVLVRHGATDHTVAKRFSGGVGSANPGLNETGRAQVRATADWLAPRVEAIDAVVASPVRRAVESARILAERWGLAVTDAPAFAEMEFGTWDGSTFAEIADSRPEEMAAWLGSLDYRPGGGESLRGVQRRVRRGLDELLAAQVGRTVLLLSHVTPIKILVADAVGAPLAAVYRMELEPASVSVVSYYRDPSQDEGERHRASLRLYNATRPGEDLPLG